MPKRIGILTGGGDCPGLNAVIRAVVKASQKYGVEVVGIRRGFEGLLPPGDLIALTIESTRGILTWGGTILGAANKGQFSAKTGHGQAARLPDELVQKAIRSAEALGLVGIVAAGGDGTLTIAQQFFEANCPIVAVPKTIDNDLQATVITFGFDSAVACATDALDRLNTTAESHERIIVLEVMGRYAGWIAMHAGIAGGANVILIPEIPFHYDTIVRKIKDREVLGRRFTLVVVAEGARPHGGDYAVKAAEANKEASLGGMGEQVAAEIRKRTGKETRTVVLGHLQRGGGPTTFDRLLATRYGVAAVQMIARGEFGMMAALRPPDIVSVPIKDAIGKIRTVPPDGNVVETARALGISMGSQDEP